MYRIGYVGASDAETTEAKYVLKVLIESYLNSKALQQQMNAAMRELNSAASAAGTQGYDEHKRAIAALKLTALDAGEIAKNSLARIQEVASKDFGIWQAVDGATQAMLSAGAVNRTYRTQSGTEISIQAGPSSVKAQVGAIPIALALVVAAVIVASIAAAVVSMLLTSSNRQYSSTVQKSVAFQVRASEEKLKLAEKLRAAADDLAAGRITKAQYDAIVKGTQDSIAIIDNAAAGVTKPNELPAPPSLGFGSALKVLVPVAIIGVAGFAAWKLGLFGVAKKQVEKRWG